MRTFALFLLCCATAAASAQPADSTAARRSSLSSVSVGSGLAFRLGEDAGGGEPNLIGFHLDYTRSVGPGPLVAQVGLSGATEILGRDELTEVHVAVGVAGAAGPVLLTLVAGPSLARVRGLERDDPGFAGGRALTVPGVYVASRAVLVVVPPFGIGAEAFAHVNAKLPLVGARLAFAFGRLPGALVPNPPPTPRRPGP